MEALGINWKILIGQIVNFCILLFLLKKFAYQPFLEVLQKRREKIEEGLKEKEKAEIRFQELQSLKQEIEKQGQDRQKEILLQAEQRIKKKTEEMLALAGTERQKILETAKTDAGQIMEEERSKAQKELAEVVFLVAQKFLGEKIDEETDKEIIERALKDL